MSEDLLALQNFTGVARLFPLPNLVLFPSLVQGLHIFEPRYRQLTAHALAGDRLIAVVLLKPGWEAEYAGRPPVHAVACLGRVTANKKLPDGRYDLQLRGLSRVRIVRELEPSELLYRTAEVELFSDVRVADAHEEARLRQELAHAAPPWVPEAGPTADMFRKLLRSNLALGAICDVLSYVLPLEVEAKQILLEAQDVGRRARALIGYLRSHAPPPEAPQAEHKFPPDFSEN